MPSNLHARLRKVISTWQSTVVINNLFSISTCGRVLSRALAFSTNPGEYNHISPLPFSKSIQSSSVGVLNTCKLVSAISGYSKFDYSTRRTSSAAGSILNKRLYGDDACFVTCSNYSDVVGIADGVGGWRQYGIDPSQFPKKLMETCETLVKTGQFVPSRPSELLAFGYKELLEDKLPLTGSSTACIVAVDRSKQTLHTANLGDSGFIVVRNGNIVHRSSEQQHSFNTPYQLSMPPEEHRGDVLNDAIEDADISSFDLKIGDVILTATDGLFDNLHDSVILKELSKLKDSQYESVQQTAWRIAEQALHKSLDTDYMSPFAIRARKSGYVSFKGGKPDDITILLSLVTTASN